MKKLTLTLKSDGCGRWDMTLPNGESVGRLCADGTSELLGIDENHIYKMWIRQTETENPTTSFVLWNESGRIWYWLPTVGRVPYTNVFLDGETDEFLTKTFGGKGTKVFIRIKIEKIV